MSTSFDWHMENEFYLGRCWWRTINMMKSSKKRREEKRKKNVRCNFEVCSLTTSEESYVKKMCTNTIERERKRTEEFLFILFLLLVLRLMSSWVKDLQKKSRKRDGWPFSSHQPVWFFLWNCRKTVSEQLSKSLEKNGKRKKTSFLLNVRIALFKLIQSWSCYSHQTWQTLVFSIQSMITDPIDRLSSLRLGQWTRYQHWSSLVRRHSQQVKTIK